MKKLKIFACCLALILAMLLGACAADEPVKLDAPTVTLTEDIASWGAVAGADKYEISINGELHYLEAAITMRRISEGDTFKVRAIGDGIKYTSSDWSNAVTYGDPNIETLGTPTVSIDDDGLATWSAVVGAAKYAYKINNGAAVETTSLSVQLIDGDSISVMAIADGTTFLDGAWSAALTYTADTEPEPEPEPALEPAHISTTVAELTAEPPTSSHTVIYELEATWTLRPSGADYGVGYLSEGKNRLEIYGLCSSAAVLEWTGEFYRYSNDNSYSSLGLVDGAVIRVGLLFDAADSTYSGYLIEVVSTPSDSEVTVREFVENFSSYEATAAKITGTVTMIDKYGFILTDESDATIYVKTAYVDLSVGQTVTVTGTANKYYSLPQLMADEVVYGERGYFHHATPVKTVQQIIEANASQADCVWEHNVYRTSAILTLEGSDYYLVDGEYKLQIKSSTLSNDLNNLITYAGKKISLNIIVLDCFSTTGIFRVSPLFSSDSEIVEDSEGAPTKLSAPTVTVSDSGVASWSAVAGAVAYRYKIGGGTATTTFSRSVQLSDGDSIVVMAVGDGADFADSDYSVSVTYTVTEMSLGEQIQAEYNALVAGNTTAHTTWTFTGTVLDMSATFFNNTYNNYNVKMVLDVDGVLIGIYNGFTNGTYPVDITGLAVGSLVTVTGTIAEKYTITSGSYTAQIEFSNPEISWENTSEDGGDGNDGENAEVGFIMINDTHGALTDSSAGNSIGRVDSLIQSLTQRNGEYIFIHAGDAFQGSYVCGETYGLAMIEALNAMELDCFVLGNHEFDWGLDKIAAYADGNLNNGEASFPFLGANIYYAGTTTRPDWIEAYTVIEYGDIKVGVIGVIGYGQESSILTSRVEAYDFASPLPIIRSNATYLRSTVGCDVVVVATHDYDENLNANIAALSGTAEIDAIFCAHTHQNITASETRGDGKQIPVAQCYHKNCNAAEVVLKLDGNMEYQSYTAAKHEPENYAISDRIAAVIEKYQSYIDDANAVVGTTPTELSKSTLGAYATEALLNEEYASYDFGAVDIAIINTAGVRATINSGDITKAEIFEVFPFNNVVVLVNLSGKLIKSLCTSNGSYLYIATAASVGNYQNLNDNTIYQLAVIDYVFEGTYYDEFRGLGADDYIVTDVVQRDLVIEYLDKKF